jgi:cellulose synthase/poly-beta-1,6-N-acetylglucosamine synthase-like glycosyltransferase
MPDDPDLSPPPRSYSAPTHYGGPHAAHRRASVHDSLSIIVPVSNDEATLLEQVYYLLDVLPDFTTNFEIVVVDDGSTDQTADVARELARRYPQLKLVCHPQPLGFERSVKTGLSAARGQTLLVQEDSATISPMQLRRLWSLRHDRSVLIARSQQKSILLEPELLERLSKWSTKLRKQATKMKPGGMQIIRRDAPQEVATSNTSATVTLVERRGKQVASW